MTSRQDRPRWVLITTDYPPDGGGIARLLHHVVEQSREAIDWRVVIVRGGSLGRAGSLVRVQSEVFRALRWAQGGLDPLVVCGHPYLSVPVYAWSRSMRLSCAAWVYGREVVPANGKHRALLTGLALCDRVLSISAHTADCLVSLGVKPERVRVVHPEIVASSVALKERGERAHRAGGLRLVAVSRQDEYYKNFEVLVWAVALLRGSGVVENLTIVGEGRLRSNYAALADWLEVPDLVTLPGRLSDDDVAEVMAAADLGCFPSRESLAERGFEGYGLAVRELAAAGLPTLVAEAAGAREAAQPEFSILLDPNDPVAWAHEFESLHKDAHRLGELNMSTLAWARSLDPAAGVARLVEGLRA